MSTQHQPATKLPWRLYAAGSSCVAPSVIEVQPDALPVAEASRCAVVPWPGFDSSHRIREEHLANAAYITHAANAYPQLVAALQTINKVIFANGAPLGSENYFAIRRAAADLLRTLGEKAT